jgi:small-conductance mechanosensitive channel
VANVISGFLIFWDRPFVAGDYVSVQDQYGRVDEITLRTTRLRTPSNSYVRNSVSVFRGLGHGEFSPRRGLLPAPVNLGWR